MYKCTNSDLMVMVLCFPHLKDLKMVDKVPEDKTPGDKIPKNKDKVLGLQDKTLAKLLGDGWT